MSQPAPLPPDFPPVLEALFEVSDLARVLESFETPKRTLFRTNPLRADSGAVLAALREAGVDFDVISESPSGVVAAVEADQREALVRCAPASDGRIYIQNPSSIAVADALGARPGERVLDLAAAPGGKTLRIACAMQNEGEIVAVDVSKPRYHKLRTLAELAGATVVRAKLADGTKIGHRSPESFDRVLLDAPCSSEARFRANDPPSWSEWTPKKVKDCARKQKALLQSAIRAVKVGGEIVYATCAFSPEENELVVAHVMKRNPGVLEIEPIELTGPTRPGVTEWKGKARLDELDQSCRFVPDRDHDGLFACRLRKVAAVVR